MGKRKRYRLRLQKLGRNGWGGAVCVCVQDSWFPVGTEILRTRRPQAEGHASGVKRGLREEWRESLLSPGWALPQTVLQGALAPFGAPRQRQAGTALQ